VHLAGYGLLALMSRARSRLSHRLVEQA